MLCLILTVGGLLIMSGNTTLPKRCLTTSAWKIRVPETHLLRLIEKHISFAFVREKLKASYSDSGRVSIDPELLVRIGTRGYQAARLVPAQIGIHISENFGQFVMSVSKLQTRPRASVVVTE
jgi:hypothetical protein